MFPCSARLRRWHGVAEQTGSHSWPLPTGAAQQVVGGQSGEGDRSQALLWPEETEGGQGSAEEAALTRDGEHRTWGHGSWEVSPTARHHLSS